MSRKSVIATLAVVASGAAALFAATKVAKVHVLKKKEQDRPIHGFEWEPIIHSKGVLKRAKLFRKELKWGLQRFVRGYDDTVFWDFDHYLDKLMITGLRWMLEHKHGSPVLSDKGWTEENCHDKFTEVLKEMLYHFEQSRDEYCLEKNEYDDCSCDEFEFIENDDGSERLEFVDKSAEAEAMRKKSAQRRLEIEDYKARHHKQALEMLKEYQSHLWD